MAEQTSITEQWSSTQDKVRSAIADNFPIEGRKNKLVLNGVIIDDKAAQHGDLKAQEEAKTLGRTWGVPVHADLSLVDKNTGQVIDRQKIRLLTLPKPTERYSYIVDGNEWQIDHLWRLRSGVYAHVKQNGDLETEFNLATPFARSPRLKIPFSAEKRRFKLKIDDQNVPLYTVLHTLGVDDAEMKKAWGKDIYDANVVPLEKIKKGIDGLYGKISQRGIKATADTYEGKVEAVREAFKGAGLLPETTQATLGKPFTEVTGDALLRGSERILQVAKGEIPPDDRDSLIFKSLHSVDDFLHDKLTKSQTQRTIHQKISNNLDRQVKVRDIVSGDFFHKPVHEFFSKAAISRNPEQTNPLEMMSNYRATTIIEPELGGIKNERSVTPEMKIINPSHLGFLDPIHTPESEKTGVSLHLPLGVKKEGNDAKVLVYDLKTGKQTYVTPAEFHTNHVVLPDQVKWKDNKPVPIGSSVKMKDPVSHEVLEKPFSEGRYLLYSAHQLFDEATNLIPFLQNNQGNRTMTAAKQATQAVSLHHREAPLVQVRAGGPLKTWERIVGSPWAHEAPVDGKVVEIQKDVQNGHANAIVIQDSAGKKHEVQIYNHFPLNDAKSFLHATPSSDVKVGAPVKKGQVLADTNFTRNGNLALGTNLRVSYLPYKGYNFEDGIVISESAAKRLTSEHVHRLTKEIDPDREYMDKKKFMVFAASTAKKLTDEQLNKLDDHGIIRVGQKVIPGDLLVAAVGKRDMTGETARAIGRLDKKMFALEDRSQVWDSSHPGEVVKVVKNPNGKGATVFVKTLEPAEIGDKIVGRHGNKGIITRVLPDHEMPRMGSSDWDGKNHVEVLMNPSGVPTRINLGQMLETAAAKIADKTGQPYLVQNFAGVEDYSQKVRDDLKKHGLKDTEEIYDPKTGRKLGDALSGKQYILKLKHQVEKKLSVRSAGSSVPNYTLELQPQGTGSNNPGMAIGALEFYALLAHGARHNLREMATYKSSKQSDHPRDESSHIDFWQRVQTGQPLPPPKPTFAYKKFEAMLTGLGINVKKEGHQLVLQPLTDKGVLGISSGEIPDPGRVLRGKDAKELEKGLFDPKVTGGLPNDVGKGMKWSHITLPEPVPNPIFVGTKNHPGPAVILSGLRFDDFEAIARGDKYHEGKTGGEAIEKILKGVDAKSELTKLKNQLPNLRGGALDKANRKVKYLTALDHLNMKPAEAYIMHHIPVLPPVFRPIVPMQDGVLRFDDINHYYKSLGHVIHQIKTAPKELGDEGLKELRTDLYDLSRSLAGLAGGRPIYESNRQMKGILDNIAGSSPKEGYFQGKLIRRRQDLSMRSTIIPEPAMHLDHVGLPKDAAMELYKPFVVREMQMLGYSPIEALKEVKKGSSLAWRSLQSAMDKRPVMLKRDPALHKFSIMAFKPKIVEGRAIQIHPLVTAGYNADFDGDTMSAFVPLTDDAVRETHKMFPSNNLFSSTHGGVMYAPEQESLLGLHLLSKWGKDSGKTFSNHQEAMKAKDAGKLHVNDVITIGGKKTTLGRMMIAQHLPSEFRGNDKFMSNLQDPGFVLTKKGVRSLLEDIARSDPKSFSSTVDHLKNLGNQYSYELGFSFGLKDLHVHKELRDSILKKHDAEASKARKDSGLTPAEKHSKLVSIYTKATEELVSAHKPHFDASGNNMYTMVSSGARGNMDQFRQMTIAPMLMKDGLGNTLVTPVKKSYTEGLDIGDYWTTLHGARMGTLQRVEGTSEPGSLTKEIANVVMPNMIVSKDCGTTQGIHLDIHDSDVRDRFLATPVKLSGGQTIPAGTLLDGNTLSTLQKNKIEKVVVRSPLKCSHGKGLCAKCYGLNENGHLHEVGTNIGIIAGHAMGEPATQLAMNSFHTGGVAASRGAGATDKFTRLNQLIEFPKTLPNAAVLAKTTGTVQKIERDTATNGWNIHINGEKHFVSAQHEPTYDGQPLRTGTVVRKGDPISDGHIDPRKYLEHTDIHTVQNYLTNELYNSIYKDERVRRRNIETVVRSLTNLTKIKDPGDSDFHHGDHALRTIIEEHNRNLEPGKKPVVHQPILRGAQQMALDQHEDWMARLNFQRLRDTILEGTAKGWRTDLHGTSPIPAYAYGAEFGKGTPTKPHYY